MSYPIALKITYSDDLKILHQLVVNSSIDYQSSQSQTKGGSHGDGGLFGFKIGNVSGNTYSANGHHRHYCISDNSFY